MGYPTKLKEAVLQKVLQGNKPHHEIAFEYGIGRSTIGKWWSQLEIKRKTFEGLEFGGANNRFNNNRFYITGRVCHLVSQKRNFPSSPGTAPL